MNAVSVVGLGALGVPVGSFLNVVIDRIPGRVSLRGPRDGEVCAPVEVASVPFQPWLLRGGSHDAEALPIRWMLVEVVTAVVFALFAARYGDDVVVVPLLVLGAALVAVSVIDLQLFRIPDLVTFPALALSVPLLVLVSVHHHAPDRFVGGLVGSIVYFAALLVPHLVYPRGMGFGDVKLALLMGLHLGWLGWSDLHPIYGPIQLVLYALMLGCALGVVFGVATRVISRRRGEFPFGPALALACVIVALFASELTI